MMARAERGSPSSHPGLNGQMGQMDMSQITPQLRGQQAGRGEPQMVNSVWQQQAQVQAQAQAQQQQLLLHQVQPTGGLDFGGKVSYHMIYIFLLELI